MGKNIKHKTTNDQKVQMKITWYTLICTFMF